MSGRVADHTGTEMLIKHVTKMGFVCGLEILKPALAD
jgi:hypothetical protein